MPKLTDWAWWAGSAENVAAEGIYEIAECSTRDEAIRAGLRETSPGEQFHIIEARMWDRATEPPDPDFMPFARTRNHEIVMTGWIDWQGGECPVAQDLAIEPRYRGAEDPAKGVRMTIAPAWRLAWQHDGQDDDIIAYRIVVAP